MGRGNSTGNDIAGCSLGVASAAAGLHGWHVMGVRILASASHSMRSTPCLLSLHVLPLDCQGRAGLRKEGQGRCSLAGEDVVKGLCARMQARTQ